MRASELEALLGLLYAAGGPPRLLPLLDVHGSPERAWRARAQALSPGRRLQVEQRVRTGLRVLEMVDIEVVQYGDVRYPGRLVHLGDAAPAVLFARGNLELTERPVLGVVGSRQCSEYGVDATRMLVAPVAAAGGVIVSGLALGIDSVAHEAALDAGGGTIAVLGCGIDICYPPSHRHVFERIVAHGLVLSEFAPGAPARPYHFPHRNRIIAMLSHAVVVVEAARLSGSLSTAAQARENVDVFAVPGPIGRRTSEGTNEMIRDGARMALDAADLLTELKLEPAESKSSAEPLDPDPVIRQVLRALRDGPRHVDDVIEQAGLPMPVVTHSLLRLELAGLVHQLPGNRFARRPGR